MCWSCKSQKSVLFEGIPKGMEASFCYFSYIIQESNEKQEASYVLEVIPPKYSDVEKHINIDDLEQFKVDTDTYRAEIRKAHVNYMFNDSKQDLAYYARRKNPIGFTLCLSDLSPEHIHFRKSDFVGNQFTYTYREVVESSKVIKHYVKTKPKVLKDNQRYFPSGTWSELKHATY